MAIFDVVDEVFGLVKHVYKVENRHGEPSSMFAYTCLLNDVSRLLNWPMDKISTGYSFDEDKAIKSAIGEGVERYCGNHVPDDLLKASVVEMLERGYNFLNPKEFLQFTKEQLEKINTYFGVDESVLVEWVPMINLVKDENCYLPADVVYVDYRSYQKNKKVKGNRLPILFSGLSAGSTVNYAIINSLLEIIERDATMLWWIGRKPAKELIIDSKDRLSDVINESETKGIALKFLLLSTEFSVYTVACVLNDYENKFVTVGFSCHFNIKQASEKALMEAYQLRMFSFNLSDPKGFIWKENYQDMFGVKDFQRDRNYTKVYNKDYSDMISLLQNTQFFLDTVAYDEVMSFFNTTSYQNISECLDINSSLTESEQQKFLIKEFRDKKIDVFMANITTSDIEVAGMSVVRCIAPKMLANMPTAFPLLGNKRLQQTLGNKLPNLFPLPHS